jgi:hypothetical protein
MILVRQRPREEVSRSRSSMLSQSQVNINTQPKGNDITYCTKSAHTERFALRPRGGLFRTQHTLCSRRFTLTHPSTVFFTHRTSRTRTGLPRSVHLHVTTPHFASTASWGCAQHAPFYRTALKAPQSTSLAASRSDANHTHRTALLRLEYAAPLSPTSPLKTESENHQSRHRTA